MVPDRYGAGGSELDRDWYKEAAFLKAGDCSGMV